MTSNSSAQSPQPLSRPSFLPGTIIAGRYRLDQMLGEGGMGVVYSATGLSPQERIALKFLKSGGVSEDARRRFFREARAASSIVHPNVVGIRDVFEMEDGTPVMAMELLQGESLANKLDRLGRLSLPVAARILLQVVSAVGAAHARGIVHRDLKPDNIFLAEVPASDPCVKVLDFGIAKVTQLDGHTTQNLGLTGTGEVLGTPNYMSPEQVFGERDLDHRADIWALGIMLYECLTGIVPTAGTNVGQVLKVIVTGQMRPLREVAPELPEDIIAIVEKMLAREREERPQDLHEVQGVLEAYATIQVESFGPPAVQSDRRRVPRTPSSGRGRLVVGRSPINALANTAAAGAFAETLDAESVPTMREGVNPPELASAVTARRTRPSRRWITGAGALLAATLFASGLAWRTNNATKSVTATGVFSAPLSSVETSASSLASEAPVASTTPPAAASTEVPPAAAIPLPVAPTRTTKKAATPAVSAAPATPPPTNITPANTITGGVYVKPPF